MPTYLKAKSPEDGWIRVVRKIMDTGMVRVDERNSETRWLDNVMIERFWRTIKYEDIYLRDYETVPALHQGLKTYFTFYNSERPHQSLGYLTPAEAHYAH